MPKSTMEVLKKQKWVTVTDTEREHLAPNVLSIAPNVIIGRKSPHLSRINSLLSDLGYTVEEVKFDGVPATGGSFRCASMPLSRERWVNIWDLKSSKEWALNASERELQLGESRRRSSNR